jgi:hypothetical protein
LKVALRTLLATLLFAATAQAGTTQREFNVAGMARPATGLLAEHLKTRPAGKRSHALYSSTFLDGVVSGISGWNLTTVMENDSFEWAALFGADADVLGFVCITVVDPNDPCYRRVFVGPSPTVTFINWFNNQAPTYIDAAIAIMTITHEANHYRLYSADEGRVNACALQQFPSVLSTYFQILPTTTKTVPVKKVVWRKKWVWVHRNGRRVHVRKRVRRVIVIYVQKTIQNPDYVNLIAAAEAFYRSQPPPYSTGTCY